MRVPRSAATIAAALFTVAAIVAATVFRLGDVACAALGMGILGALVWVSAPPGLAASGAARWARHQVPALAAGAVTAGVVLAAITLRSPAAAWSVLAGVAAVAAAYLVALPRDPRDPRAPRTPRGRVSRRGKVT